MKIKKGDRVKITTGKDKGKTGAVLKVLPKKHRIKVEGISMQSKHLKPSAKNQEGGIVKSEGFIDISNVLIVDNKSKGQGSRVGYRIEGGKKVRFAKKSKAKI